MPELSDHPVVLCRKVSFSSGHRYFNPDWSEAENRQIYGSQYSQHGHGHNFVLEAYLEGGIDPETGMVINLKDVDALLREVVEPMDHRFLNRDVPFFQSHVPTTENIARYCFERLQESLAQRPARLVKVRLREGENLWVDYGSALE
jgi:6-pyruvoyltetrahydropterin/6-carboxytetrahydropterin synthase